MGQWTIPCVALAGFTMLLSWLLRRVRCVDGYRGYWGAMMVLTVMWLAMGAITGRDLYRFANRDFSGPAGNVGLLLILLFVAWSLFVVPNLALVPSLLIAFPRKPATLNADRKRMLVVVWPIIFFQLSLLCFGAWAIFSGIWGRLLSL